MNIIKHLFLPLAAFSAALLLLCVSGCGGNDTSTGPGGSVTFTSDNSNPGVNSVAIEQISASGDSLRLGVRVVSVQNVFGAAFEIRYPPGIMQFRNFAPGDFLTGDGASATVQVAENPLGTLIIGATRLGNVGGISGSGTLLSLNFQAVAPGSGRINFNNPSLRDPNNNIIPGIDFIGGFVNVTF